MYDAHPLIIRDFDSRVSFHNITAERVLSAEYIV